MPRFLTRIVALLVVACLVFDPVSAAIASVRPQPAAYLPIPSVFSFQAFSTPDRQVPRNFTAVGTAEQFRLTQQKRSSKLPRTAATTKTAGKSPTGFKVRMPLLTMMAAIALVPDPFWAAMAQRSAIDPFFGSYSGVLWWLGLMLLGVGSAIWVWGMWRGLAKPSDPPTPRARPADEAGVDAAIALWRRHVREEDVEWQELEGLFKIMRQSLIVPDTQVRDLNQFTVAGWRRVRRHYLRAFESLTEVVSAEALLTRTRPTQMRSLLPWTQKLRDSAEASMTFLASNNALERAAMGRMPASERLATIDTMLELLAVVREDSRLLREQFESTFPPPNQEGIAGVAVPILIAGGYGLAQGLIALARPEIGAVFDPSGWRPAALALLLVAALWQWNTRDQGIANVQTLVGKYRPDLLERYQRLDTLTPGEIDVLRQDFYRLSIGHFNLWELSTAMKPLKTPYFHGSYIEAAVAAFPRLELNPLGFVLDWSTPESGVESVRYVLRQKIPLVMKLYDQREALTPTQKAVLRNEIYDLSTANFLFWGLASTIAQRVAPYFHGSHAEALVQALPELDLNRLGFTLDWRTYERGIESIRYVLNREVPRVMERYGRIETLTPDQVEALRADICEITQAHFKVWELSSALRVPYFGGRYMRALTAVFNHPRLDLQESQIQAYRNKHYEIRYEWTDYATCVANIRDGVRRYRPDLVERYDHLAALTPLEVDDLRKSFYRIASGHLSLWKLSGGLGIGSPFNRSYIDALQAAFPDLHLNRLGFRLDFTTPDKTAESIRFEFARKLPQLFQKYEQLDTLKPMEIEALKRDFYRIDVAHFVHLGLGAALGSRSYVEALQIAFPKLELDPIGFYLDWSTREKALASIRFVLNLELPSVMKQYDQFDALTADQVARLREEVGAITHAHLTVWKLTSVFDEAITPFFHGNHFEALQAVFPRLDLNPMDFNLDWTSIEQSLASARYRIGKHRPSMMERYNHLEELSDTQRLLLRNEIYELTLYDLDGWGLSTARNKAKVPYFDGSYIPLLLAVFNDPRLGLQFGGFKEARRLQRIQKRARRFETGTEKGSVFVTVTALIGFGLAQALIVLARPDWFAPFVQISLLPLGPMAWLSGMTLIGSVLSIAVMFRLRGRIPTNGWPEDFILERTWWDVVHDPMKGTLSTYEDVENASGPRGRNRFRVNASKLQAAA